MIAVLRYRAREARPDAAWRSLVEPDTSGFVARWIHDFDIELLDERGHWLAVLVVAS